jgi:hypothetical protein
VQPGAEGNPNLPGIQKKRQNDGDSYIKGAHHDHLHFGSTGSVLYNDVIQKKNLGYLHGDVILITAK